MKIRKKLIKSIDKLSLKMSKQAAFAKLAAKTGYSPGTISTYYYADKKRPVNQPTEYVVDVRKGNIVKIRFV